MKKVNLSLMSIFVVILLSLFTISATSAWAATYYVDAIYGNDATGVPDNINLPFKTITKINTFFKAGAIVPGDYIKFRKGTTPGGQTFRGPIFLYNCTGYSGAPITFTSYSVNVNDTDKPLINSYVVVTDHVNTGWTGPDANGVYTHSSAGFSNLCEDQKFLPYSSGPTIPEGPGHWYATLGPTTLYYKPSTGVPADHIIEVSLYGRAIDSGSSTGTGNSYITIDGLSFINEGIRNYTIYHNMTNWLIQYCDFLYAGVRFFTGNGMSFTDITVQNCNFSYCKPASMQFENSGNGPEPYLRLNVLNNKATYNNTHPQTGQPWDTVGDRDCLALQSIKDSNIIGNELSGSCLSNAGITYWTCSGQQTDTTSGPHYYSGYAVNSVSNSGGLIHVSLYPVGMTPSDGINLVTGNRIVLYGLTGSGDIAAQTTGEWTVTVSGNDVALQGSSAFSGTAVTTGAKAYQEANLPSTGNVISKNYIHDVTGCGIRYDSGSYPSNHSIQICNNIIANYTGNAGIRFVRGQSPTNKSLISNNFLYNGTTGINNNGGGDNYIINNNIIHTMTGSYLYFPAAVGSNDINHNCYYDVSSGSKFNDINGAKTFAQWKSETGWDANSLAANPLSTNQSGAFSLPLDFQLQTSSPCINAGKAVGLTSDFWANPIPASPSPVDVGVHQLPAMPPPPPPVCTYSISPTGQSYPSAGGSGSIQVTSVSNCNWTAAANVSWITITTGTGGVGSGQVTFSVAANTTSTNRNGVITAAGQQFSVTQAGATVVVASKGNNGKKPQK